MAMIKQYKKKNGEKAWYFKTYLGIDPMTKKKKYTTKRGFKTQKEAKIALSRLELEIEKNGLPTKKIEIPTFREVYNLWYEQYKNTVKESTLFVQKNAIEKHILPKFGSLSLDKITVVYCQEQVNNWFTYYKKYSNLIGLTTRIIDYGLKIGLLSTNPMNHVIRPRKSERIDQEKYVSPFYSKEQLKSFLEILNRHEDIQLFTMFRVMSFTGLRKGELQALRWKDCDLSKGTISVNQTLQKVNTVKKYSRLPKQSIAVVLFQLMMKLLSTLYLGKKSNGEDI